MVPKGVIEGGGRGGMPWRQPPPPQRLAGGWAPLGVHGSCHRGANGRRGRKQKKEKWGSLGAEGLYRPNGAGTRRQGARVA